MIKSHEIKNATDFNVVDSVRRDIKVLVTKVRCDIKVLVTKTRYMVIHSYQAYIDCCSSCLQLWLPIQKHKLVCGCYKVVDKVNYNLVATL